MHETVLLEHSVMQLSIFWLLCSWPLASKLRSLNGSGDSISYLISFHKQLSTWTRQRRLCGLPLKSLELLRDIRVSASCPASSQPGQREWSRWRGFQGFLPLCEVQQKLRHSPEPRSTERTDGLQEAWGWGQEVEEDRGFETRDSSKVWGQLLPGSR